MFSKSKYPITRPKALEMLIFDHAKERKFQIWFHRKFLKWENIYESIPVVWQWKNEKLSLSHWKEISSNQLFSNFFIFSKTIAFTTFLRKKCEREFLKF